MAKRIIAFLLTSVLIVSACFVGAFAASPYKYGDVDLDGKVNSTDALKVLQFSTGLISLDSRRQALADTTNDTKVNSSDALEILRVSTGIVDSVTKNDANTLKTKIIDPVYASQKRTVGVSVPFSGLTLDCSVATNGKARATSLNYLIEIRFLEKDGKTYILIPSQKKYCEAEVPSDILMLGDMVDLVCQRDAVYDRTTTEKSGLKTYTCENYYDSSESYVKYYFSGNTFVKVKCGDASDEVEIGINEFKATAADSLFTIPSDYQVDESLKDMFS